MKRDFKTEIEQLQRRRDALRSALPITVDITHLKVVDAPVISENSTAHASYTDVLVNTQTQPHPALQSTGPMLGDIIACMSINRLDTGGEGSCLEGLNFVLSNQHKFLTADQLLTLRPAHVILLLEIIMRSYNENVTAVVKKSLSLLQHIAMGANLDLCVPLHSSSTTNALIEISLDKEFSNEALNIIEASAPNSDLQGFTVRLSAAVYNRANELITPLIPSVSFQLLSIFERLIRRMTIREAAVEPNTLLAVLKAANSIVKKTAIYKSPLMYPFDISSFLNVLNLCFEVNTRIGSLILVLLSSLIQLHPSYPSKFADFATSRNQEGDISNRFLDLALGTVFPGVPYPRTGHSETDWDALYASMKLLVSLSRSSKALSKIESRIDSGQLLALSSFVCSEVTAKLSPQTHSHTDGTHSLDRREVSFAEVRDNAVYTEICLILESCVELLELIWFPFDTRYDTFTCSACGQYQSCSPMIPSTTTIDAPASCSVCLCVKHLFDVVRVVCDAILLVLCADKAPSVVEIFSRIAVRLSKHFNLTQLKQKVTQLCLTNFQHPKEFDLRTCPLTDAVAVFCGFVEPVNVRMQDLSCDFDSSDTALDGFLQWMSSSDKDDFEMQKCFSQFEHHLALFSGVQADSEAAPMSTRKFTPKALNSEDLLTRDVKHADSTHNMAAKVEAQSLSTDESDPGVVSIRNIKAGGGGIVGGRRGISNRETQISSMSVCICLNEAISFKPHTFTCLLASRSFFSDFLSAWSSLPSVELFRRVVFMQALSRSSGLGSLSFIFPDLGPVAEVLCAVITGDKAKLPSDVTIAPSGDLSYHHHHSRGVSESSSRSLPRLVPHNHSSFLRSSKALTSCCLKLLIDILSFSSTSLIDYRPLSQFLCVQLDVAAAGFTSATSHKGMCTQGLNSNDPGRGGMMRVVDDLFIRQCLDGLTSIVRANDRGKQASHSESSSTIAAGDHFGPVALPVISGTGDALRELICSKLMTLGDLLVILGEGSILKPLLTLLMEVAPILGNVVTNTSSGSLSLLSEPRAVVLVRVLISGLSAHRSLKIPAPSRSAHCLMAVAETSHLACQVILAIAKFNSRAFKEALSRVEVEVATCLYIKFLLSIEINPDVARAEEIANRISLYVDLAVRVLWQCLRKFNSHPQYSFDPMWSWSIIVVNRIPLVHVHTPPRLSDVIRGSEAFQRWFSIYDSLRLAVVSVAQDFNSRGPNVLKLKRNWHTLRLSFLSTAELIRSVIQASSVNARKNLDINLISHKCFGMDPSSLAFIEEICNTMHQIVGDLLAMLFALSSHPAAAMATESESGFECLLLPCLRLIAALLDGNFNVVWDKINRDFGGADFFSAVIQTASKCSDSVEIHKCCLSIFAAVSVHKVFSKSSEIENALTANASAGKSLHAKKSFQLKITSKFNSERRKKRSKVSSLDVEFKETSDKLEHSIYFLVHAMNACPHGLDVYRYFCDIFIYLSDLGSTSRELLITSECYKLLFLVVRGLLKNMKEVFPASESSSLLSESLFAAVGHDRNRNTFSEEMTVQCHLRARDTMSSVFKALTGIQRMVADEAASSTLYGCQIFDSVIEIMQFAAFLLNSIISGEVDCPLSMLASFVEMVIECSTSIVEFLQTKTVRAAVFSNSSMKAVEDSTVCVANVIEYLAQESAALLLTDAKQAAAMTSLSQSATKSLSVLQERIDKVLKLQVESIECVVS